MKNAADPPLYSPRLHPVLQDAEIPGAVSKTIDVAFIRESAGSTTSRDRSPGARTGTIAAIWTESTKVRNEDVAFFTPCDEADL